MQRLYNCWGKEKLFAVTKNKPTQVLTTLQGLTTDDPDKFLKSATNFSQKLVRLGFVYKVNTD